MTRAALAWCALAASLTLGVAACGGGFVNPSKNQTTTFNGTIQPGGFAHHEFSTSKMGEYKIVLTTLQPSFSGFVTVLYGLPQSNGRCAAITRNDFVRAGTTVAEGVIQPGTYCVEIGDQGTFTTAETYTLTVSYP